MPFLKSGLLNIHYRISGTGPKLLFIPGTSSDLRQEVTIFDSPLAKVFEILYVERRGIGQTNSPDRHPTMKTYARDVKKCLKLLGWDNCYCVGESFGGMIAQEFAINYPDHIEKLVLIATSSGGNGGSSYPFHEHDLSDMSIEKKAAFWVEKNVTSELRIKHGEKKIKRHISRNTHFIKKL